VVALKTDCLKAGLATDIKVGRAKAEALRRAEVKTREAIIKLLLCKKKKEKEKERKDFFKFYT
jgi:hypothetical protein